MWKSMVVVVFLLCLPFLVLAQQPATEVFQLNELLVSEDGMVSIRVPEGWYQTINEEDTQSVLIAAETPERAASPNGGGELIFHVYVNSDVTESPEGILAKTLKDQGISGAIIAESPIEILGISGTRYDIHHDELGVQAVFIMMLVPDSKQWVRVVGIADDAHWDSTLAESVISSIIILPEQATTPKGWSASIRAPIGWEEKDFSSFAQWIAPDNNPFAGTEVWFQAGFRTDLIGQGETPFVLRSLGVNYTSQVNQDAQYATIIGGLPATALPFESFTHSGISFSADGSTDFGTANLVARTPNGKWTPAHQALVESMLASVQIAPPTGADAPFGLRPGYRAPEFSGTLTDGTDFALSDYEGKLVFVHFWFVDCPFCREEYPRLQAVYDEYKDQGMVLLAINAIDPLPYIESYMASENLDFPVIQDNGSLHQFFGITAFPTTFVIGPDGIIVRTARGPMSDLTLNGLVTQYLTTEQ